jgi:hypothetical protein
MRYEAALLLLRYDQVSRKQHRSDLKFILVDENAADLWLLLLS